MFFVCTLLLDCMAAETLSVEALTNPEKLLVYRNQVTERNRVLSEKLYQYGLGAEKKNFATAVKAFSESALVYPTSVALMKLAEHRAKLLATRELGVKYDVLHEIIKYLHVSDKLNEVDDMLSSDDYTRHMQNMLCTEHYLEFKKTQETCRPVMWLGIN